MQSVASQCGARRCSVLLDSWPLCPFRTVGIPLSRSVRNDVSCWSLNVGTKSLSKHVFFN